MYVHLSPLGFKSVCIKILTTYVVEAFVIINYHGCGYALAALDNGQFIKSVCVSESVTQNKLSALHRSSPNLPSC